MRLVDEDGRDFADFFDMNGHYLGSDDIDDGKIYLISNSDWEEALKVPSTNGSEEIVASGAFFYVARTCGMVSSPSVTTLSDEAIFNIVSYYNDTELTTKMSTLEKGYLITKTSSINGPLEIEVPIDQWRYSKSEDGRILGRNYDLNDYYAIKSCFDNEQGHINLCKMIGPRQYTNLTECEREKYALTYQMQQQNYQKANCMYRSGIQHYYMTICNSDE